MTVTEPRAATSEQPRPGEHDEPWLARLARFSGRRRRTVMLGWLAVILLAAPLALTLSSALSGAGWEAQGSTAQKVRDELRRDFPRPAPKPRSSPTTKRSQSRRTRRVCASLVASLQGAPGAASVVDPLSLPADAGMISPDGRTALVPVELAATRDADLPKSAGQLIDHVKTVALPAGATAKVTGEWAVWSDFNAENEHALHLAELVSGLPTVVLLFVAFGSAIAAGIPLLLAVAGIFVGWAALHLLNGGTPLSVWSMNFSMMIGLAVGIDYSLFIVSRYREEREDGYGPLDAIANTLSTAGKAVFLSALTVVLSLAAVFLVPVMVFRSMALGMILAVDRDRGGVTDPAARRAHRARRSRPGEQGQGSRPGRRGPLGSLDRDGAEAAGPHIGRRARAVAAVGWPRARDAARHARRARGRQGRDPVATDTTWSPPRSGQALPRRSSSPPPPLTHRQ